jgi:hypothetical protein
MKEPTGSKTKAPGTDNGGATASPERPVTAASRPPTPAMKGRYRIVWFAVLLGLVTVILFWPSVQFEFVSLDDNVYVTANPKVQKGVTAEGLRWAFTNVDTGTWHPLTWISHMMETSRSSARTYR